MQRMDQNELLNTSGGGLFTTITNIVISIISFARTLISLKKFRG